MDKKLLFNEALTSLVDFATANANHVTMDDVKLYFNFRCTKYYFFLL